MATDITVQFSNAANIIRMHLLNALNKKEVTLIPFTVKRGWILQ